MAKGCTWSPASTIREVRKPLRIVGCLRICALCRPIFGNVRIMPEVPIMRKAKLKQKKWLLAIFFVFLGTSASPAHAVIPQLLGPLTALLSIVPQILAFVGVALITALVLHGTLPKVFL